MLTLVMKQSQSKVCQEHLTRYEQECDTCVRRLVTGNEPWPRQKSPENKRKSIEYRHKKNSHIPKQFKVIASVRKVMMTIFCDCRDIYEERQYRQLRSLYDNFADTPRKIAECWSGQTRNSPARQCLPVHESTIWSISSLMTFYRSRRTTLIFHLVTSSFPPI